MYQAGRSGLQMPMASDRRPLPPGPQKYVKQCPKASKQSPKGFDLHTFGSGVLKGRGSKGEGYLRQLGEPWARLGSIAES